MQLSQRAQQMPSSGIRAIMELAFQIPEKLYRLEAGEPGFRTPEHILTAVKQAADEGFTKYTSNAGIDPLRIKLAEKVGKINGIKAAKDNILVTTGGVGALFSVSATLMDAGDEVLIPNPSWPNVFMMLQLWGINTGHYPLYMENEFVPRVKDIEPLVTPKTKAIFINNPSNPTGANFPERAVRELVDFALAKNLYLISDEVYDQIIYKNPHFSAAAYKSHENIVTVYSFSKTYAMTGFRLGYLVAHPNIIQTAKKLQEPSVSCTNSIAQKAAIAALDGPQECVAEMVSAYRHRRDLVVNILKVNNLYEYTPQGAFYILVNISRAKMESYDFAKRLLLEKKVAVAPGATFGSLGGSFVRLSLASPEDALIEGTERLCKAIQEWGK